jgi:hypothetical protein
MPTWAQVELDPSSGQLLAYLYCNDSTCNPAGCQDFRILYPGSCNQLSGYTKQSWFIQKRRSFT